MNWSGLLLPVR